MKRERVNKKQPPQNAEELVKLEVQEDNTQIEAKDLDMLAQR